MTEAGTSHGNAPPYEPLSDADVEKIIQAVFQLLRETGVKFDPDPRAMGLFADAGCDVSTEGIVKFPTDLVKSSLDSVTKGGKIWNRPGTEFIGGDAQQTSFLAGITCTNVIDIETGEQRPSTREDLAAITRVADALPDIDAVCLPCKIVEKSNVYGEIEEFAVLVANTTKPLSYLCENELSVRAAIEIAAAIRGGVDRLMEKPYFSLAVTPLPLYYAQQHIDQIFVAIENGIPVGVGTGSIGGASAPVTIAGSLVHCFATEFAGTVLGQLIKKGCSCTGGSTIAFMDPKTGSLGGLPQMALAEMAKCQIARSLGLPAGPGNAGLGTGKVFDQYTASTAALTMMGTVYCQPGSCVYLGSIDSVSAFSLHSLLYCHELVGLVRSIWRGIRVDDETLALDVTRNVGPGGNYLAEMHTAAHCRTELWETRYFRGSGFGAREQGSKKDLIDRIDEDLRTILGTHQPEPLPDSIQEQIEAILKKFGVV